MRIPTILSWMIKANETGRAADQSANIGAFGDIASQAGKSQIRRVGWTALFAADDVIDVKGKAGVGLMNETVFRRFHSPAG